MPLTLDFPFNDRGSAVALKGQRRSLSVTLFSGDEIKELDARS